MSKFPISSLVAAVLFFVLPEARPQPAQLQAISSFTYSNGVSPGANLCPGPDANFYGTTTSGGTNGGYGTIFRVTTNGVLTSLASFAGANGSNPQAGLTRDAAANMYGATTSGGTNGGYGTVFKVDTNGVLASLASFANTNGAFPYSGLTLGHDGNFYGTTFLGGSSNLGTVYRVTTNGVLTSLVSFADTNGANPRSGLALANDGDFYGTTTSGGTNGGYGTMFKVTTSGVLTSLASFANTNGAYPRADLAAGNDGSFYGTTYYGGSNSLGTVFRVTTNGIFASLASFNNANGANPAAGLTLGSDGNFYGTTYSGGAGNVGTLFQFTTNGILTTLASLAGANGAYPYAGLTPGKDGDFYGATSSGGAGSNGVVLKLVVPPVLAPLSISNHFIRAALAGLARPSVQIQTTTNLTTSWSVLTNLVFTNGAGQFTDSVNPNNPQRFYRAMVQ